jgi:hypothetical protein
MIMAIDPTLRSPVSALVGALVGGVASLLGAIDTHRSHDRVERVASEIAKRETVYGLINRMRLFGPTEVIEGAEAVFRAIVEILLKPSIELRQPAKQALSKTLGPDPLLTYSEICRADLDNAHRRVV